LDLEDDSARQALRGEVASFRYPARMPGVLQTPKHDLDEVLQAVAAQSDNVAGAGPWPELRQALLTRRARPPYKSPVCSINCSSIFPGLSSECWCGKALTYTMKNITRTM
jgi:hypothetical protein